jgi:hypothetical protein
MSIEHLKLTLSQDELPSTHLNALSRDAFRRSIPLSRLIGEHLSAKARAITEASKEPEKVAPNREHQPA